MSTPLLYRRRLMMAQSGGEPTPILPDGWEQVNYVGNKTSGSYNLKDENVTSGELTYFKATYEFMRFYYCSFVYASDFSMILNTAGVMTIEVNGVTWATINFSTEAGFPTNKVLCVEYSNNTLIATMDGDVIATIGNLSNPNIQGGIWFFNNYPTSRSAPFKVYGIEYVISSVQRRWIPVHSDTISIGGYSNTIYEIHTQTLNSTYPLNIYG